MDKIIDGHLFEKAKFLRTTCKQCGKQLKVGHITGKYSWCNKKCKKAFIRRNNKKYKKYKKSLK